MAISLLQGSNEGCSRRNHILLDCLTNGQLDEILEHAGNAVRDYKKTCIIPRRFSLYILNDNEIKVQSCFRDLQGSNEGCTQDPLIYTLSPGI